MNIRNSSTVVLPTPDGTILPGHWTARVTEAAAARAARREVAEHHGRAGVALLRPGEHALTAQHIIDYGRTARPPASPATRTAAKAVLAAALAQRRTATMSQAGTGLVTFRDVG